MNQVTEMLRLAPGASEGDAVARLSTLFELMSTATGFHGAELLRSVDEEDIILVTHTWDYLEDWQAFQTSDAKVTFAGTRPAALYSFVPCGMNWLLEVGASSDEPAPYLHREILRERVQPYSGVDVVSSQTFSYQDYDPKLANTTMRLSRLHAIPAIPRIAADYVVADEVYELLHKQAPVTTQVEAARYATPSST